MQISKLVADNNNDLYLLIYPWPAQLAYKTHLIGKYILKLMY